MRWNGIIQASWNFSAITNCRTTKFELFPFSFGVLCPWPLKRKVQEEHINSIWWRWRWHGRRFDTTGKRVVPFVISQFRCWGHETDEMEQNVMLLKLPIWFGTIYQICDLCCKSVNRWFCYWYLSSSLKISDPKVKDTHLKLILLRKLLGFSIMGHWWNSPTLKTFFGKLHNAAILSFEKSSVEWESCKKIYGSTKLRTHFHRKIVDFTRFPLPTCQGYTISKLGCKSL